MDSEYGLLWKQSDDPFAELEELSPIWTVEPDKDSISIIARRQLGLPASAPCTVDFLAMGCFNKVYIIRYSSEEAYIMRITLPVHLRLKTMSERATIEYVKHHMSIPAPQVLCYNALRDDELGFEWMIQEYVPGFSLSSQWRHMGWLEKEVLVRKVIEYLVRLFRKRFQHLGNVYAPHDLQQIPDPVRPNAISLSAEHSTGSTGISVSEIVSIPFFYHDHGRVDIQRGPYTHSRDWLVARLQLAFHDAENMTDVEYDDDHEDEEQHDDDKDEEHADKHGIKDNLKNDDRNAVGPCFSPETSCGSGLETDDDKQVASRSSTPDSPCGSSPEKDYSKHISSPSSTPASSCGSDSENDDDKHTVDPFSSPPDSTDIPGPDKDDDEHAVNRCFSPDSTYSQGSNKENGEPVVNRCLSPVLIYSLGSDKENEEPVVTCYSSPDPNHNSDSDPDADPELDSSEYNPDSRTAIIARISRLQSLIPKVFPATDREAYVLHHQDLSGDNILVTPSHALAGIIDWECVHTVPLWLACQIPRFLRGTDFDEPPEFVDDFENEWLERAYYDDIEDYEKTELREFFLQEMQRVCPEWIDVFEESELKADFEFAVSVATTRGCGKMMDKWIAGVVENGETPFDLRARMGQY
jgi:aminoglycoside phosphotransferase (APT) family kinase protein